MPSAAELAERLREPLAGLGLSLPPRAAGLLSAYVALLLPWNDRVNLTGARSAAEVIDRQLADAFALVSQLPPGSLRLLDAGAGAGFLGITAAILRPETHCVLLEPIGKKHAFLRAVARELPLPNLEALAERLEDHCRRPDLQPYDVAVSQATWPPAEWLERAHGALRPGGIAIAFEGKTPGAVPREARRVPYLVGARRGALLLLPR
jgi:16S rRNA (guanine527-N7)-methyltransferase